MAARVRTFDWSATPLGPVPNWPQSLKTTVDIMLGSGHAMMLAWGPERTLLYNDAYAPMLGSRHPDALGLRFRDAWPDIWDEIAPLVDRVFAGETIRFEDMPLTMTRHGHPEETWWNFSYSPVRDETGTVVGLLNVTVDAASQVRTNALLRESDEKFRTVFEAIDQAFVIQEIIRDETNRAIDMRYVEINPAFTLQTGFEPDIVGKLVSEVMPDVGRSFIDIHDRVARTGISERFENYDQSTQRWYDAHIAAVGGQGRLAASVFADITERKQGEIALRESDERQAFLLELSDALRSLSDPIAIQTAAMKVIGSNMRVNRAFYGEAGEDHDTLTIGPGFSYEAVPLEGVLRFSEFELDMLAWYQAGRTYVIRDTEEDTRFGDKTKAEFRTIGVRAAVGVPLVKDGQVRAIVSLHQTVARKWTDREIALLEEVAERTWAAVERAHAEARLRESEDRQTFLLKLSDALRQLADANAIQAEAMRLLGEYLGVHRAQYYIADETGEYLSSIGGYTDGVPAAIGRFRLIDFGRYAYDGFHAGETQVVADATTDARISEEVLTSYKAVGFLAYIGVPFVQRGRLLGTVAVHQSEPRRWTASEQLLVEETAERAGIAIEQARAEAALRESEGRHAFLLRLSDALRPLADPTGIQAETTRLLREQLNAGWCYYVEWDLDRMTGAVLRDSTGNGLPSLAGTHDVADVPEFLHLLAGGAVLTVRDYAGYEQLTTRIRQNFTALGFRAMMAAPLVKDGRLIATLIVGDTRIRDWSESEASLLLEVAERTWAAIERARAEAALHESEIRLAQLADAAPVLIWETGKEGATFVNGHYLAYFGVAFEDIAGFRWEKYIHPDDLDGYAAAYRQAFAERRPYDYECRLLRADGQYRWHRTSGRPSSNGRFIGSCTDIHALLVAEQALRQREEQQRLTIELVPALLWSASPDGQEVTPNEGWSTYTGQSEPETQNYGWLDAIHPDDLPATRAAFEHAFATGEPIERQQRIHKAGDGYRWHLVRHVPVRDEDGAITRWFGAAVDIHDSKLAEQALQEAERRLQTLVEGVPQLVWRASDPGIWTWASPQWTDYTGQAEADSHGWGWLDPVHPDDRESVRAIWAGAIERGEFHADYRLCHAAEQCYRWFQTRATPVRDSGGRIFEWLGTSTDVDDLRQLQERQRVLVGELQHRTFNLMGMVRSMVDSTVRSSGSLEEFRPKFRDRIDALARVQRLLSRLQDDDRVTFDALIRSEFEAVGALPADDPRVTLVGPDGVALRSSTVQTFAMAVHELTTNAVKYGALGQPEARLDVEWHVEVGDEDAPWLHLSWHESGVAIPPAGAVPRGTGQGRSLIEEALPYQLHARTTYVMAPDGVRCTIALPVSTRTKVEMQSAT